jgi:hypothetical protein
MIQAHYRDAVALSARTLGALFSFSGKRAGRAAGSGSARRQLAGSMAFPLADSLVTGFAAASDEPLPRPGNACLLVPGRCPPAVGFGLAG